MLATRTALAFRIDDGVSHLPDKIIFLTVNAALVHVGAMNTSGDMIDDKITVCRMIAKEAFSHCQTVGFIGKVDREVKGFLNSLQVNLSPVGIFRNDKITLREIHMPR